MKLVPKNFQKKINGKQTDLFILKNKSGCVISITNFGGRIIQIIVPDHKNNFVDVVMGFDDLNLYRSADCPYYGATIGRIANRISNGQFTLGQKKFLVPINEGNNHLHGGFKGFHNVVWDLVESNEQELILNYKSLDMEEGYPGNLDVQVQFILSDSNDLTINYEANCDKLSIINLTNHAFFNMNGESGEPITEHRLKINADYYTPVNSELIPTGSIEPVLNTPFDFTTEKKIGSHINDNHQQLIFGNGYDHNYVLNKQNIDLELAAKITGDISGIEMSIFTTEPGLQFYSGNFMKGKNKFKQGHADSFRTAFALETQHFPDSPNHEQFPSVIISPNQIFRSQSVYKFRVNKL